MAPPSKACCRCREVKPLSEFYRNRSTKDGLNWRCKACQRSAESANPEKRSARHRRWREKNPDWSAENNKKWRQANPGAASAYHAANRDKARLRYLRRAARRRNATIGTVNLASLWESNQGRCQLCDQPIDRSFEAPHSMSASVDHIVPLSKGGTHEQSNLQWTHLVCNKKKGSRLPVLSAALPQGA